MEAIEAKNKEEDVAECKKKEEEKTVKGESEAAEVKQKEEVAEHKTDTEGKSRKSMSFSETVAQSSNVYLYLLNRWNKCKC